MPRTNEISGGDEPLSDNGWHWKYLVTDYEIFQVTATVS